MTHISEYDRKEWVKRIRAAMLYLRDLSEGDESSEEFALAQGLSAVAHDLEVK